MRRCLEALAGQQDLNTQALVVSAVGPSPEIHREFPWVSWLVAPRNGLVPELWSFGLAQARNDVVAFTTTHFAPAPDWLSVIRQRHRCLEAAGVGGPIDPPRGGGSLAWATYFLRYSAYLDRDREGPAGDLAGDNAAYKRRALAPHAEVWAQGFWEQELHRRLLEEGQTLVWVPAMRVLQQGSFPVLAFLRGRFLHGMRFGRVRLRDRGWAVRATAILASPLIPVVFSFKIAARVLRSGRDRWSFVRCLPVLLSFVLAWSAGEALGYVRGEGRWVSFKRQASPR